MPGARVGVLLLPACPKDAPAVPGGQGPEDAAAGRGWTAPGRLPGSSSSRERLECRSPSPHSQPLFTPWLGTKEMQKGEGRLGRKKKKKEAKAKEGIWAAGEEGRRLPEDPTELASVRISTAVPKAQNKHGGNASSLQTRAALSLPSRAPSAARQAPRRAGVGDRLRGRERVPRPFPSGTQRLPEHAGQITDLPLLRWWKTNPKISVWNLGATSN